MITRPEQDRAIAAAWRTALLDAGVGSDEVHLVPFSSADGEGFNHASHNGPGESTGAIELSGLDDETARARANDLNHPRITVWRGVSPEILMPLLRHELEHFLQWRDGG